MARVGWSYQNTLAANDAEWYFFQQPVHAGGVLTATLNWYREMEASKALPLDNLDLELWRTDGLNPIERVTLSNSVVDNVEHIHRFEVPDTAFYALSVRFKNDVTKNGANTFALAWLLPESQWLAGDANLDGRIDHVDFDLLRRHFGGAGGLNTGDVNWDHHVDLRDFALLRASWNLVPEANASFLLLLLAASRMLRRARRIPDDRPSGDA